MSLKKLIHLNFKGFDHVTVFRRNTYIYHRLITEPNEEGKDQQQASPVPDPVTHLLKSQTYQSWLSYQQSNANRPFSQMSDGGSMNVGSKLLKLRGGSESTERHCRRMKACQPTAATGQLWPQKGHVLRSEA